MQRPRPGDKQKTKKKLTVLVKKCHYCGHVMELEKEAEKCTQCQKSFLPLNYFTKVHDKKTPYKELFAASSELQEEDLVKGLNALW